MPVGRQRRDTRLGRDELQAMLFNLHVPQDVRTKRTRTVRERGTSEAGMKFIGDRSAADLCAALQNERPEASLRQIECGDEPVVPPANNYDVVRFGHGQVVRSELCDSESV